MSGGFVRTLLPLGPTVEIKPSLVKWNQASKKEHFKDHVVDPLVPFAVVKYIWRHETMKSNDHDGQVCLFSLASLRTPPLLIEGATVTAKHYMHALNSWNAACFWSSVATAERSRNGSVFIRHWLTIRHRLTSFRVKVVEYCRREFACYWRNDLIFFL